MIIKSIKAKLYKYWPIALIPLLGILFFFIAVRIVNPTEYPNKDFFTFWLAGRLALLGQNPYNNEIWIGGHHLFGASWIPNATYIYPYPLSLIFIPLGLLPLYQAFVVWVFLTQFMIVLSASLLLGLYSASQIKLYILPIFTGIVIFRPTIITLTYGQLSGFLLLVIVFIIILWERGKWWQGTIFLPILALKPNLGVPIIILLLINLFRKKEITSIIAGGISGLVLLGVGLVQNPKWISEFLKAGNIKLSQTFGFSPTIWGISTLICDYKLKCTIWSGSILGIILLIGTIYLLIKYKRDLSPAILVGLVITIMLIITPYTWPYDQLLLVVPIIILIMNLAKAGYKFIHVGLIFIIIDLLAFLLLGISAIIKLEILNVTIPLSVLGLLVWSLSKSRKPC